MKWRNKALSAVLSMAMIAGLVCPVGSAVAEDGAAEAVSVKLGDVLQVSVNSKDTFALPLGEMGNGLENYTSGLSKIHFFSAFGWSVVITLLSVLVLLLCTSMCAWYITRTNSKLTNGIYYVFVFSMIVPFRLRFSI